MQTHLDCIPCFLHQSLEAARMATSNELVHEQVMKQVMKYLETIDFHSSPPEISREVHAIIKRETGVQDPYLQVKNQANNQAKQQLPQLLKMIDTADDPLLMAVKLAIVGNVIDFGTMNRLDSKEMINNINDIPFNNQVFPLFEKRANNAKTVLYLSDNTGEIIFDRLLVDQLVKRNCQVTFAVKKNPIINDATRNDAEFAEIDKIATIIEGDDGSNYSAPGFVSDLTSTEFKDLLSSVDLVISKGQGNYESLNDEQREIFFLLMVKCPLVAGVINIDVGTMVLTVNQ